MPIALEIELLKTKISDLKRNQHKDHINSLILPYFFLIFITHINS